MTSHPRYTLEELVAVVNEWCEAHQLAPASGQSAEQLSTRTVRYYRTIGLIDAPTTGLGKGYGELHRVQLAALRVLQAQGLPLRRIQSLLFGRTMSELEEVLERGVLSAPSPSRSFGPSQSEDWRVVPLDDSVLLILRNGRKLSPAQVAQLQSILTQPEPRTISSPQPERTL